MIISSLPYTAINDTSNYADNYDPVTTASPSCTTSTFGNYYHGGNDVIYSYTAQESGIIKDELACVVGWTGLFIYTNCENIGVSYDACATSTTAGNSIINDFAVTAGQTYYFYVSSWPAPQTFAYTFNVTQLPLGVDGMAKK